MVAYSMGSGMPNMTSPGASGPGPTNYNPNGMNPAFASVHQTLPNHLHGGSMPSAGYMMPGYGMAGGVQMPHQQANNELRGQLGSAGSSAYGPDGYQGHVPHAQFAPPNRMSADSTWSPFHSSSSFTLFGYQHHAPQGQS
eukprot:TRINITY_DN168_c0_g1_i10.p1 TRINITY_DN168_c0_g1~~TRINITY_DN168_c0_g1_i10.p1  ORF type:complete len:140 (-),score=5.52 TRINITY_DN168_c0_g1_i10:505-924(-)